MIACILYLKYSYSLSAIYSINIYYLLYYVYSIYIFNILYYNIFCSKYNSLKILYLHIYRSDLPWHLAELLRNLHFWGGSGHRCGCFGCGGPSRKVILRIQAIWRCLSLFKDSHRRVREASGFAAAVGLCCQKNKKLQAVNANRMATNHLK